MYTVKIIAIYATCIPVSLKMLSSPGTMETQFDVQGNQQGKASEIEEARQGVQARIVRQLFVGLNWNSPSVGVASQKPLNIYFIVL